MIKAAQAKLPKDAPTTPSRTPARSAGERIAADRGRESGPGDRVAGKHAERAGPVGQLPPLCPRHRQLQRDQEEIAQATKEIGQKTLGRDSKDLDAQQQADLKKLAGAASRAEPPAGKSPAADGPDEPVAQADRSALGRHDLRRLAPGRSSRPSAGRCGSRASSSRRTSSARPRSSRPRSPRIWTT